MQRHIFHLIFIVFLAVLAIAPVRAQNAPPALPLADVDGPSDAELDLLLSEDDSGLAGEAVGAGDPLLNPYAIPEEDVQKTPEEIEEEVRQRAFDAAVTGLLPLRPDDIRKLMETFDKTRQAVEVPLYPYPEPEVVVETVSLDPGARPPEIKVAVGHVTTINILDITGAPWPIGSVSWSGNFEIIKGEEGSHFFVISPMSEFTYGNISIVLLNLKTPITFVLKTHRDKVHYRFDARIPEYGPFAETPLIEGGLSIAAGDSTLHAILDGVPPAGAVKLDVAGVDNRTSAYSYNTMTYVRTPLTLLSPGWSSSVSSADGTKVYALNDAPVLLLSDQGQMVRARIGNGDLNDE